MIAMASFGNADAELWEQDDLIEDDLGQLFEEDPAQDQPPPGRPNVHGLDRLLGPCYGQARAARGDCIFGATRT